MPGVIDYVFVDNVATLVWLANLAAIELHAPQWRLKGDAVGRPDLLVIDLDPGPPAGLPECCMVAIAVRHRLQVDQREAWVKTSGKKGMQLLTPIYGMTSTDASSYARHIAEDLDQALPELVTSKMTKALRPGKSSLIGARTTHPGRRCPPTRCAPGPDPPCRPR